MCEGRCGSGVVAAAVGLVAMLTGWAGPVRAAPPLPLVSAQDAERVFVSGVEERFDAVRAAVEKAAAESGQAAAGRRGSMRMSTLLDDLNAAANDLEAAAECETVDRGDCRLAVFR